MEKLEATVVRYWTIGKRPISVSVSETTRANGSMSYSVRIRDEVTGYKSADRTEVANRIIALADDLTAFASAWNNEAEAEQEQE